MDNNKHRFYLTQILTNIYADRELAHCLGFKGGTALMFFYDLPRFSVDLDFDLIHIEKAAQVFQKVKNILLQYGEIHDEAQKFFGDILVLDYGRGERNLKLDISHRASNDRYEVKNLLGVSVKTMNISDMFAHKLMALLGRAEIADRDIFDCWFFMNRKTLVNKAMLETLSNKTYSDYMQDCIHTLENLPPRSLLYGLGELVSNEMKPFVKNKLQQETITLLKIYQKFPLIA